VKPWALILIFFTIKGLCNPFNPVIETGNVRFAYPSSKTVLIQASNGAIIEWEDFSVGTDELTRFIQPSQKSWVLNRVRGNNVSEILGQLEANGQVMLINPNGILFGKDAIVEVGGLIASSMEGAIWSKKGIKPQGDIKNYGTIRSTCGDVVLVGREVRNEGTIEILLKTEQSTLIRSGKNWNRVKAEENPYGFAINCEEEDAHCVISEGGRIILKSDEATLVRGALYGTKVSLLSEGITVFDGHADVGSGSIEISGRNGFIHNGTIQRKGGSLLLDPEADITISQTVNYNHFFEKGTFSSTADIVNISIDKLIEEIEKGPVTITTSYQGEGGGFGSIIIKNDVNHTYTSSYPLLLFSTGWGGVNIEGSLTNKGSGAIQLKAPLGEVSIPNTLDAAHVGAHAQRVHVQGEVYGNNIFLSGEKGIDLEGLIQVDGGDLVLESSGSITIRNAAVYNLGTGSLMIQGWNGSPVQNVNIIENGGLFTSSHSKEIVLQDINGGIILDGGSIVGNHAPIHISGKGSLQLKEGNLTTHAPISIELGRYFHIDNSQLTTMQPLNITLGEDLVLTGNSFLSSPGSMTINAKGEVLLNETSMIKGRGISIVSGESTSLFMNTQIEGGYGPVFISAGKDITFEKGRPKISAGQLQLHAGHYISMETLAELSSRAGAASITAGRGINLCDSSRIHAHGGDLNVIASQGNITLYGSSVLSSVTHGTTIIAGKSLVMENLAHIDSVGETGTTIVVDHLCSGGGLVMTPLTSITSGHSPLRIFTAKRTLNSIEGRLNGYYLIEAPLYLNTSSEKWGLEYPNLFFSSPFTLFHKDNGLIQLVSGGITQKNFTRMFTNFIGPYTAELFRDLHPYDAFINRSIQFQNDYDNKKVSHPIDMLSSFDVLSTTHYFIRTPTRRHDSYFFEPSIESY
jgi:filamentous hemagglutinin family protein